MEAIIGFQKPSLEGFCKRTFPMSAPLSKQLCQLHTVNMISILYGTYAILFIFLLFLLLNCLRIVQKFQKPKPLGNKHAIPMCTIPLCASFHSSHVRNCICTFMMKKRKYNHSYKAMCALLELASGSYHRYL